MQKRLYIRPQIEVEMISPGPQILAGSTRPDGSIPGGPAGMPKHGDIIS